MTKQAQADKLHALREEARKYREHADQLDARGRAALAAAHRATANTLDSKADDHMNAMVGTNLVDSLPPEKQLRLVELLTAQSLAAVKAGEMPLAEELLSTAQGIITKVKVSK